MFGVSTGSFTPGRRWSCCISSAWSLICGTNFGETNAVASITRKPACASRSISCSLVAVVTVCRSFCSPSRGPTSTILTVSACMVIPALVRCARLRATGKASMAPGMAHACGFAAARVRGTTLGPLAPNAQAGACIHRRAPARRRSLRSQWPPPPRRIDAPGAGAGRREEQEHEAVQDSQFALVEHRDRHTAMTGVAHEVRERHFAAENERHWPGQQADEDQRPADEFQYPGNTDQRKHLQAVEHRHMRRTEQLRGAVREEQIAGHDPQQRLGAWS